VVDIKRRYIIASTPRSGSSLLCEGLCASGVAGRPAEVFAPDFRDPWYSRWKVRREARFEEYLEAALRFGTTPNGIYAMKIQWMHVPVLAVDARYIGSPEGVLDSLFPGATFVNIVRRDRRAQAISWFRACETNEWFRTESTKAPDNSKRRLDIERVRYLECHLDGQQSSWERYFRDRNIQPLIVEYERLANGYRGEIARVLAFLGLDPAQGLEIPNARLFRQADSISEAWRRQMDGEDAQVDVTE
jgi:trehalose 2-sulfotransferase